MRAVDKNRIEKNFSKHARQYDSYSAIQELCARELVSKIDKNDFRSILDIGCGTGCWTELLKEKFPLAEIKAVDISYEMIKIAQEKLRDSRIRFIKVDGEEIDFDEEFDLISSNAVFHWFVNLKEALLKYRCLLKERGVILFSFFGPRTFFELERSLKKTFAGDISISSSGFPGRREIEKLLAGFFKEAETEERLYRETYSSLRELLKRIKYTGTKGMGITDSNSLWTPKAMAGLERDYRDLFKDINVTYQVFFCKGLK